MLIHFYLGNNWGKCEDGTSGMGCGPQETFRSCADIQIVVHPLLMSATKKGQQGQLLHEEATFYDVSLLENELASSPSSAEDGGAISGAHILQLDEIFHQNVEFFFFS